MILKSAKKTIFFSLLIFLFTSINQQIFAESNNQEMQQEPDHSNGMANLKANLDSLKANLDTTQRIILQSLVETFWNLIKENQNTKITVIKTDGKEYKLDLTEFGKILSNLAVDELIPTPKQNYKQKVAELLTPTVIACLATKIIPSIKGKKYLDIPTDLGNLGMQLLIKLLMVRLFLKPGTMKYHIANLLANLGSFYKYNPEKSGIWKYASIHHGITKLTQDEIKVLVDTADLNTNLNKIHRKKAIRKIIQSLIDPYMEFLMDKACIHY